MEWCRVVSGAGVGRGRMTTSPSARVLHEKLHKVLANAGLGSRRHMEQWIANGRVSVNGKPAAVGQRVSATDQIEVDGKPIRGAVRLNTRILAMNKCEGHHVTRIPPSGVTSVFDELPPLPVGRWISVGRLDVNTSGLLLFTNDGELAHRLMHPSSNVDREYAVRAGGVLEEEQMEAMTRGVEADGTLLKCSDIRYYNGRGTNHWYHVVLNQGRNREVRRLFQSQGLTVSRLKRVRFGPIALRSWVRKGKCHELVPGDVAALCRMVGHAQHGRPHRHPRPTRLVKSLLIEDQNELGGRRQP